MAQKPSHEEATFPANRLKVQTLERKQSLVALRKSKDLFQKTPESVSDAIFVLGDGTPPIIIDCNRGAEKVFGYTRQEMLFRTSGCLHISDVASQDFQKLLHPAIGEEGVFHLTDFIMKRKDGTPFHTEHTVVALNNEEGLAVGWVSVVRDTTGRKRCEAALRVRERQYRALFEDSKDAVYIATREGNYIDVNRAFMDLYGYTREEISNLNSLSLWANPEDRSTFLTELEKHGAIKDFEAKVCRKDGTELDCLLTSTALRDDDGTVIGSQGIVRDVTEMKRNQQELHRTLGCLRDSMEGTIQAIALTVERRDPCTAGHQRRVADLARAIAQQMRLSKNAVDGIRLAGMIHDLGKISVPADILSKPGRLTEYEFALMKTHPQVGHDILKEIEFPWPIAQITMQHHERMDGSGYPRGLSGDEILLEAKILSVADVVEAMVSHRPYRPALTLDEALEEIARKGGALYDPDVVAACLRVFSENEFKFRPV